MDPNSRWLLKDSSGNGKDNGYMHSNSSGHLNPSPIKVTISTATTTIPSPTTMASTTTITNTTSIVPSTLAHDLTKAIWLPIFPADHLTWHRLHSCLGVQILPLCHGTLKRRVLLKRKSVPNYLQIAEIRVKTRSPQMCVLPNKKLPRMSPRPFMKLD